jgi:hypothetical protein
MAKDEWTQGGTIPASGRLSLFFTPYARQDWTIEQCSPNGSVQSDNNVTNPITVGGQAVGAVYVDGIFLTFFIANKDTLEGRPVYLRNGRKFEVRWTGATVGATVGATIYYDDGTG